MRGWPVALAAPVLLTGCALQPSGPWALVAASLAAAWLWSCFSPPPQGSFEDGGADSGTPPAMGTWERCCKPAGDGGYVVGTCLCPPGAVCNYGWYSPCGDGACVLLRDPSFCPGGGDAGHHADAGVDAGLDGGQDAGGTWESCCEWNGSSGVVSSCFCPDGVACNYGWYTTCPGGSCALTQTDCP